MGVAPTSDDPMGVYPSIYIIIKLRLKTLLREL